MASPGDGSRAGGLPLLGVGLVLAGLNLRMTVASVPPLLTTLERHLGMSPTMAGALTSMPYVCFGVLAPAAPALARRMGAEATLAFVLATAGGGALLRAAGSTIALVAGTVVAAAGIAVANVIGPAIIKGRFPARVGPFMGLYTAALSVGAAVAGGLAVPAGRSLGWQAALAIWAAPVALAVAPLAAAARRERNAVIPDGAGEMRTLLRDPLAWQLTLFFGLQAAVVFSGLSWLPSILRADGYSEASAGLLLSVYAVGGLPASLAVPIVAARMRHQRWLVVGAAAIEAAALTGLAALPGAAPAWVVLFAVGQGASFSLALTLVVLRSPDMRRSAEMSGMAQAIGYCIAALGPFAVGGIHDATGGWTPALLLLLALCAPMALAGAAAGRPRFVRAAEVRRRSDGVSVFARRDR